MNVLLMAVDSEWTAVRAVYSVMYVRYVFMIRVAQ